MLCGPNLVMTDLISTFLIEPVTYAGRLHLIGHCSGDLDQPFELAEEGGVLGMQVEKHIIVRQIVGLMTQYHRCDVGHFVTDGAVGDESGRRECPQQRIETLDGIAIRRIDHDLATLLHRLGGQSASGMQPVVCIRIEIDLGHIDIKKVSSPS